MANNFDELQLRKAWSALSQRNIAEPGWQSIPLGSNNSHFFQAAIQFPEKNESILVHFHLSELPREIILPKSHGFSLINLGLRQGEPGIWLALCRQPSGDIEMFSRMASDILDICSQCSAEKGDLAFKIFLHRIFAWQNFMKKAGKPLSLQEQIGLNGELEQLSELLAAGIGPYTAISFWRDPSGGLHDYAFPSGVLEVKSTTDFHKIRISSAEHIACSTSFSSSLLLCH